MSIERIYNPNTRWYVFFPEAIEDFENLSAAELNEALASGLGYNITCAVNQDGSNFDLGDSETDDSLTFCQVAGAANPTSENPDITIEVEVSKDRLADNTASTANALLAYPGVEYFFGLSVGEEPDAALEEGDEIKLVRGETDFGVPVIGSGENQRLSQAVMAREDVAWNVTLGA